MSEDRPPSVPFTDRAALELRIHQLREERAAVSAEVRASLALIRETIARVRRDRLASRPDGEPPA
jgi:hypothetical protein